MKYAGVLSFYLKEDLGWAIESHIKILQNKNINTEDVWPFY